MTDLSDNVFLAGLGPATLERLRPHLKLVPMKLEAVVYPAGGNVEAAYFPTNSILSQVSRSADGAGVETAMVGKDGASGIIECLASGHGIWESMVQVDGEAWRASREVIRKLADDDRDFVGACWRLAESQIVESRQSVACQALHPGASRLARWILEAHDRSGGRNPLPLTQEVLATMLGLQRTTVTAFQGALAKAGLIRGRRGRIWITDKQGLEALACECRSEVVARRRSLGLEPMKLEARL